MDLILNPITIIIIIAILALVVSRCCSKPNTFYHGTAYNKKDRQLPPEIETNYTRKCKACDTSLTTVKMKNSFGPSLLFRCCSSCGAVYLSDHGLENVLERIQERDDAIKSIPSKRKEDEPS